MANWWTPQNQKIIVGLGTSITGYSVISKAFEALPSLPGLITKPIFGEISILTICGALAIYNLFYLYTKF